MKENFERKVRAFGAGLMNAYKDEDDREIVGALAKPENDDELTEDFKAILAATWRLYRVKTNDDADIVDFTHILNKLAFQIIMEARGMTDGKEA